MKTLRQKLLLSCLVLTAWTGAWAQDVGYVMCVTLNNGTIDRYLVADHPSVNFIEDKVQVATESVKAEYAIADVKDYTFVEMDPTGIEDAVANTPEEGITFKYVGGSTVSIRGIDSNAPVSVYALNGQKMDANIVRTADGAEVSVSALPAGTYIINIKNNKSIKILKR